MYSTQESSTASTSCSGAFSLTALLRRKPLGLAIAEGNSESHGSASVSEEAEGLPAPDASLKRSLTVIDLVGYGVGCTVGAGIYSMIGQGSLYAGPAVVFSFIIGAISCALTGLAYSEFAARVPVAGSAYTYSYTCFGELVAWTIGWDLTLEYAISAAVCGRSGASYFVSLLTGWGIDLPTWLYAIPIGNTDTSLSLIACSLVLICTAMMLTGAAVSSRFNIVVTCMNLTVLAVVVVAGLTVFDASNWFAVDDSFAPYGLSGIFKGAGAVFFTYIGFDMVSCLAEEVRKPQRDMPLGILGSLCISGVIYSAVALVVTGMLQFTVWGGDSAPLYYLFTEVGMPKIASLVAIGSVLGSTTATFTCLLGQPRIFFRMSKDGLLFDLFSKVSDKTRVPTLGSIITGVATALLAFCTSVSILSECISIGTLFAFSLVDLGVVTLRYRSPERPYRVLVLMLSYAVLCFLAGLCFLQLEAPVPACVFGAVAVLLLGMVVEQPEYDAPATFKCPLMPFVPAAGIAVNMLMLAAMTWQAWVRLFGWMALGYLIYFGWGIRHSKLRGISREEDDEILSSEITPIFKDAQELDTIQAGN